MKGYVGRQPDGLSTFKVVDCTEQERENLLFCLRQFFGLDTPTLSVQELEEMFKE